MSGVIDPYLIPGTNVLRNKAELHDAKDLEFFEGEAVSLRYTELTKIPLKAEGTIEQERWIHHFLFQDVYEWAGQIRTIDMSKGGDSPFQPLQLFSTGEIYVESTLRKDNLLRNLDRAEFIKRIAANYDNLNTLHPFREGNGRTQRIFWSLVARDAGWCLDWQRVSKAENDRASFIAHQNVDYSLLEAMFDRATVPLDPAQDPRFLPVLGSKSGREGEE